MHPRYFALSFFCFAHAAVAQPAPAAPPVAEATSAAELPQTIPAADKVLRFSGRWDTRDAAGPRAAWSGSEVTLRFRGTAANARMRGKSSDRWQVVIDGKPGPVLTMKDTPTLFNLTAGLPAAEHSISLTKMTEAHTGTAQLLEFQLDKGAQPLPPIEPKRRIEVIGDSISCGYGVEGKDQNEHFSPLTENNAITYGAIAARKFDAGFTCIAWSGKKMWPDNSIPEIYDLALPADKGSTWDFSRQKADVVLINLCTNDFGKGNPEEEGWVSAYATFLERVRKNHPDATIYCAVGPMITDAYSKSKNALTTAKSYIQSAMAKREAAGDKKVRFIEFATQGKNGFGSDWHPNAKQNRIMADTFAKAIEADLGWKSAALDASGWKP
jgi:lysophospholipase L1-like esterase